VHCSQNVVEKQEANKHLKPTNRQQSDFDQIANARERVKRKKEQPTGYEGRYEMVHYISQPVPDMNFAMENTDPTLPHKASLNASLHTTAEGEFGGRGAESPFSPNPTQPIENTAFTGIKQQETVSCVNYLNCPTGGGGNRTRVPIPIRISVYVCIQFFVF